MCSNGDLIISLLNIDAMAGKRNVPYELTVVFLQGLLVVALGCHVLTA